MEGSCSRGDHVQPNLELVQELQVENQLLERYLKQKNVELPPNWSEETLPTERHDCSSPIDFKLQIAIETLSRLNNTLETRKEAANKLITTLKVMLNETELRIGDIQRDAHDFQRDVVEGGRCTNNPERYKAEKFVRYMEGKLYDQESALDKLMLLNSTFLNKQRKLEAQLNREEDASFHFIDYHQMQIRHKQNKQTLEAKASKVALRKIAFEKSKQKIDTLQAQLQELKAKAHSNEKAVVLREAYSERLDELVYSKEDEVDGLKNILKNKDDPSQMLEDEPSGPDVMEYIMQKAEIYELRETIKAMERKVEIAKGNSKFQRKEESRQSSMPEECRSARWTPGML
ncbi:hypothetical protein ACHAXR_006552 [Thalassiosira sp. AJA248-18]